MTKRKYEKEFTIQRETWLRGEGIDDSYLLRKSDKKMCCLGQILEQCGIPKSRLKGMKSPMNIKYKKIKKGTEFLLENGFDIHGRPTLIDSILNIEAMDINDDTGIDDGKREKELRGLFAAHKINLKFKGKKSKTKTQK